MASKSVESISWSLDISTKNSGLFVPALAPLAIHLFFAFLAYTIFPERHFWNVWLLYGGYFISSIVGFIASCVIVDMTNDIISGRSMDLNKSLNLIMNKSGTLILAAIISAICFITFILIPVALFIITIAIIEGTDAIQSTENAFNFVIKNLSEVIIFIIIVIVVSIILGLAFPLIPVVGVYIGVAAIWMANVIFTVASVYFYLGLRQQFPPPPPPPLPPPPPPT